MIARMSRICCAGALYIVALCLGTQAGCSRGRVSRIVIQIPQSLTGVFVVAERPGGASPTVRNREVRISVPDTGLAVIDECGLFESWVELEVRDAAGRILTDARLVEGSRYSDVAGVFHWFLTGGSEEEKWFGSDTTLLRKNWLFARGVQRAGR